MPDVCVCVCRSDCLYVCVGYECVSVRLEAGRSGALHCRMHIIIIKTSSTDPIHKFVCFISVIITFVYTSHIMLEKYMHKTYIF